MGGYRDWDDGDWPPARPRRVEGGIKARSRRGQIGESWWSGRFVAILESLGMGPRLGRGRAYARAGQVLDLRVAAGTVSAHVQGSRPRPYRVSIGLARFGEADWARVESALAARALYSAKLLPGLGGAVQAHRRDLLPARRGVRRRPVPHPRLAGPRPRRPPRPAARPACAHRLRHRFRYRGATRRG